MNYPEIIGTGHLCQDIICVLPTFVKRASSNHVTESLFSAGGAASQAMVCFSRFGGNAGFIGTLGDDDFGISLKKGLVDEKVDCSFLYCLEGVQSSYSVVLVEADTSERSFVVCKPPKKDLVLTDDLKKYISKARCLHIDGTNTKEQINIVRFAKDQGLMISMDGCSMGQSTDESIELAKMTDILIMNERFPFKLTESDDIESAFEIIKNWGPKVIVSTLGERGLVYYKDGKIKHMSAYKVDTVDTTGAGDVFHGAFLYEYFKNKDIEEALRFASAVSAINCQSLGGRIGIPDLEKTKRFISEHEELKIT